MKLSVTKISTYLDCPRKYWYSYKMKIETPKSEGFYFGSAIHKGLENYYLGKDPIEGVRQSLFGKKARIKETAREGVDPYKLYKEAKRILKLYPKKVPKYKPLFVEHFFEVDLIQPKVKEKLKATFRGKIDLITTDSKVIDHKTGMPNSIFMAKNVLQSNGYAYAYLMLFGKLPDEFLFNHMNKGNSKREPEFEINPMKPSLEDVCDFFETCRYVLDEISQNKTQHNPKASSWGCRFCQYKNICSYRK